MPKLKGGSRAEHEVAPNASQIVSSRRPRNDLPIEEVRFAAETCVGLFLSSGCFWVFLPVLLSQKELCSAWRRASETATFAGLFPEAKWSSVTRLRYRCGLPVRRANTDPERLRYAGRAPLEPSGQQSGLRSRKTSRLRTSYFRPDPMRSGRRCPGSSGSRQIRSGGSPLR